MKTTFIYLFSIIAIFGILVISCDKEGEPDTETQTALDNAKAEEAVSQTFSTVNHYGINEDGIKAGLMTDTGDCATLSVDTNVFPKTLTIDFGTTGCVGFDGRTRTGKIIAKFSNHWYNPEPNTNVEVTFDNFTVDGASLQGTYTITYNGTNDEGGPSFTIDVTDAKIVLLNTKEITWSSTETVDWISGYDNFDVSDDVILITGSSSGVNTQGLNYEMNITKALKKDMSCDYIIEGTVELKPEGLNTRTLDFGDGTCDDDATVTVKGVTINISLS